jgi:hypothetical protein
MFMSCDSWCLNELVKRVRPHGCLPATRAKFLGEGDQDAVDIFGEFVGACGVE